MGPKKKSWRSEESPEREKSMPLSLETGWCSASRERNEPLSVVPTVALAWRSAERDLVTRFTTPMNAPVP